MDLTLENLNGEFAQVMTLYNNAESEYAGKSMPDEVRTKQNQLHERAMKLKVAITEKQDEIRRRDMEGLTKFTEEPQYRTGRNFSVDSEGFRNELSKKGWELKNGIVCAPTSKGITVEMWPEEVIAGPMPDEPQARELFSTTRASMKQEYRDAYVKLLRTTARQGGAMAFSMLTQAEQKALSEGQDTTGGFLVPPDIQAEILVRLPQFSIMRSKARIVTTSRDRMIFPAAAPNITNGSIYSSGFVGGWVGETPAFTDTDPSFQTFELGIKKIRVATKLSNDFVADAAANPLSWLAMNGAENMGLVEDQGFIAGVGDALHPMGLINVSGLVNKDIEGSTADTISNTTSNTGSAPKLIDVVYALPSQYVRNAEWLMTRASEGKIRKLTDAQGRFLWPLQAGSMFGAPAGGPPEVVRMLMEYRVNNSEFMPNDGQDTQPVLIFGDLSQYIIGQRAQISTVILRERFADTDQTGIILFERVGGGLWNYDAIRGGIC